MDKALLDEVTLRLIGMIPSFLWFLFAIALIALFYRTIRDELLPNLGSLKAGGVELTFSKVRESIDASLELAAKSPQWKVEITSAEKERAIKRARNHIKIFNGTHILWVDDHPENNLNERRMFRQLAVDVDTAKSSQEALDILSKGKYDIIISDMARGDDPSAGIKFLEKLRERDKATPVIFYIGVFDPAKGNPPQAFGITNRPDELLHLILDALERK